MLSMGWHTCAVRLCLAQLLVLCCLVAKGRASIKPLGANEFASLDGRGNSVARPDLGAAGSAYISQCGVDTTVQLQEDPLPRDVSNLLLDVATAAGLGGGARQSELLGYWGQFLTLDLSRGAQKPEPVPMIVPRCDERFDSQCTGQFTLPGYKPFERSQGLPSLPLNGASHFLDASQIYGTSNATLANIREFVGGRLAMDPSGLYPRKGENGLFILAHGGGNSNPVMTALITLFFREHNQRAAELEAGARGAQSDEALFQRARQHVIGLIQKITYEEYLPMLLGDSLPVYNGYNASVDPRVDIAFSAAAYRYGHYTLNGLVRLMDEHGDMPPGGHILLRDSFFNVAVFDTERGFDQVFRGVVFVGDSPVELRMCDDFRNEFYTSGTYPKRFDLGAVDITRGRDAGVPRYSELRSCFGLGSVSEGLEEAFGAETGESLAKVYSAASEVDPLVGMLAEAKERGRAVFLPPLLQAVLRDQFVRLRDGDRFFYQRYPEEVRRRIESRTLSSTIRAHSNISCLPANVFQTSRLSACFGGGTMAASVVMDYDHGVSLLPGALKLYWSIVNGDTLSVLLLGKTRGFMAIGFGSRVMRGADVVHGSVAEDGTVTCVDAKLGSGRAAPKADARGNIVAGSVAGFEANGITGLQFQRLLNTGDPSDFVIPPSGPVDIIFSMGSTDTLEYHGFSSRGAGTVDFGKGVGSAAAEEDPRLLHVRYFHGLIMATAWLVVYPVGVFIARYFKHQAHWTTLHITANASGTVGAAGMAFMAMLTAKSGHFPQHGMQGLGMCCGLLGMLVLGWFSRLGIRKQTYPYVRLAHRVLGRCMVLFAPYQCWMGVQSLFPAGGPWKTSCERLIVAWTAVVLLSAVVLEEIKRRQSSAAQEVQGARAKPDLKRVKAYTWAQVWAKTAVGAQWVVLDDLIYDVHQWLDDHPGGKRVLLQSLGTDVTKEFRGEPRFNDAVWAGGGEYGEAVRALRSSRHGHSSAAAQRLETMLVGRISDAARHPPPLPDPSRSGQRTPLASASGQRTPLASASGGSDSRAVAPRRMEPSCAPFTPSQRSVRSSSSSTRGRAGPVSPREVALAAGTSAVTLRARTKLHYSTRPTAPERAASIRDDWSQSTLHAEPAWPEGAGGRGPDELRRAVLLSRRKMNSSADNPVVELILGLQAGHQISVTPGECIEVQAVVHGQAVLRTYTPVQADSARTGTVRLLVKLATRPVLGVMSDYLQHHLQVGGQLRIAGPRGTKRDPSGAFERVVFVCAGSGVTDALLLLDHYDSLGARSHISVLYSERSRSDFVCKDELADHVTRSHGRVRVRYTVTDRTQDLSEWEEFVGRVDAEMLRTMLRDTRDGGTSFASRPASLARQKTGKLRRWVREVREEVRWLRDHSPLRQLSNSVPGPASDSSDYDGDEQRETADDGEEELPEREEGAREAARLTTGSAVSEAASEGSEDELAAPPCRVFICGPVRFELFVQRLLLGLGHAEDLIHICRG